jgi:transposase-like protein
MNKRPGYPQEVRERAVRLVLTSEHEHSPRWAATKSVASKIGCTPETLRSWINKMKSILEQSLECLRTNHSVPIYLSAKCAS